MTEPFTLRSGISPLISQTKNDLEYWKETIDSGFLKREKFLFTDEINVAVTPLKQDFYDDYMKIYNNSACVLSSGINNNIDSVFSKTVMSFSDGNIPINTCIKELTDKLEIYISE